MAKKTLYEQVSDKFQDEAGDPFKQRSLDLAILFTQRHGVANVDKANAMAADVLRLLFGGWDRVDKIRKT